MSETKDEIAAERDQLRAENENLRGQLAAAGATRVAQPAHTFMLSEGARQDLELYGVVTIGGRRYTADEVRAKLAESDTQSGVTFKDADPNTAGGVLAGARPAGNVEGVDYVYPSISRGQIDPAVAGQPGINGPAADVATEN